MASQIARDCPFCGSVIVGEFEEDLENHIMSCRDKAPGYRKLTTEHFKNWESRPKTTEQELYDKGLLSDVLEQNGV